jgi:thiol-disulfide isomerase/thioredoxin
MKINRTLQIARHEQKNTMKSITKLCLILTTAAVFTSLPAGAQVAAPAWNLPCIYGTNINSTNFAGKVVVLNFFATWCGS